MRPEQRIPFRSTFNPDREFIVRRPLTLGDRALVPGDVFPKTEVALRRLRQLYDQRVIRYPEEISGHVIASRRGIAAQAPESPVPAQVAPAAPEDQTDIPEGWAGLPWAQRKALGMKFGAKVTSSAQAVHTAIEAELERRGAS